MTQTYTQRRKMGTAPERAEAKAAGPSMRELAAGAAPTQEQMGSRVDLPGEIREKMENSFGADFSNVRLYESQTVADAGAEAMTQGNNIAFAPGKLDLTSTSGQALLGHELSHVVSQARGESAGQGFLNDPHLEAQTDTQGEMAARGESVYSGPATPVGVSSTVSAAGPMQAKKSGRGGGRAERRSRRTGGFGARARRVLGERFGRGGGAAAPQEDMDPSALIPDSEVPETTFAGRPLTEEERYTIQHVQGFPRDFWEPRERLEEMGY